MMSKGVPAGMSAWGQHLVGMVPGWAHQRTSVPTHLPANAPTPRFPPPHVWPPTNNQDFEAVMTHAVAMRSQVRARPPFSRLIDDGMRPVRYAPRRWAIVHSDALIRLSTIDIRIGLEAPRQQHLVSRASIDPALIPSGAQREAPAVRVVPPETGESQTISKAIASTARQHYSGDSSGSSPRAHPRAGACGRHASGGSCKSDVVQLKRAPVVSAVAPSGRCVHAARCACVGDGRSREWAAGVAPPRVACACADRSGDTRALPPRPPPWLAPC